MKRDQKRSASGSYVRHDRFWAKAKDEGFAARSVYKLEEMDQEHRLIAPGSRVLDLGCAPGSWLQYAAAKVGKSGKVVGVDLEKVTLNLPQQVVTLVMDLDQLTPEKLPAGTVPFDVVLSDLAPHTTGIRNVDQARAFELSARALLIADRTLKTGGSVVVKSFQGQDTQRLLLAARQRYSHASFVRPKATRKPSFEVYLLARGFHGAPASEDVLAVL